MKMLLAKYLADWTKIETTPPNLTEVVWIKCKDDEYVHLAQYTKKGFRSVLGHRPIEYFDNIEYWTELSIPYFMI